MAKPPSEPEKPRITHLPSPADYRGLAEFRYQIRRFLRFSEDAARAAGIEPQQHQVLLAIRGLPEGRRPTIKTIAERMCVQHHTTVALADNLERRGFVRREHSAVDRREVLLAITQSGDRLLRKLSTAHHDQLQTVGPTFVAALRSLLPSDKLARPPAPTDGADEEQEDESEDENEDKSAAEANVERAMARRRSVS